MSKTQEQIAREWAETILNEDDRAPDSTLRIVAEMVIRNTGLLTMKDIEWRNSDHYLAGATLTHADGLTEDVVMFWPDIEMPEEYIVTSKGFEPERCHNLTPNGKRYTVVEESESLGALRARVRDLEERVVVLETELAAVNASRDVNGVGL